ncbi:hypothetical protein DFH11DRAFT_1577509 [Phellopilus nigrolimitatus]|nr:hypothetical protein DFH11DRAFT_1577509 [Phellopilus nigrolimitatus]
MPLSEFSLRLQHGITGGFAPPTPSAIHTFTKSAPQTHILIASTTRADGTPSLTDAAPKSLSLTDAEGDATQHALVNELYGILKSIPTESPPGSEDIYRLDTSIFWQSDDLMWINGGPQGCGGGTSEVQPTDKEKAKFGRAVEIVNELLSRAQ